MKDAVKTLIDQTFSYHQEEKIKGSDLADLYMDDCKSFLAVHFHLGMNQISAVKSLINDMDTEPREQVVCAIAKEKGNDWVAEKLGWEVA